MIDTILILFYFILPAGFANIFASLSRLIFPKLNYPMDFYKTFNKERILGSHKTFRGLIFGICGGIIGSFIQYILYNFEFFRSLSLINYSQVSWLLVGFLFGFGAIIGDAIKSFFKRQTGIKPGEMFMPFDQIDWVIGALVFIMPLYVVSLREFLLLVVLYFLIHLIVKYVAFIFKLERRSF